MAETRSCEVVYSYEKKNGKFHQFGNTIYYDEGNQAHSKLVAIVELEDGKVITADPHQIKFTD